FVQLVYTHPPNERRGFTCTRLVNLSVYSASKVTLYQPVTSIWRVCSKQNRCRHFQIYCLLQFPCNFGINWKKGCAEILLQQKKTAPTFAP
ncbi:unnamed protein product, partial [Porites evermanni]